MIKTLLVPIFPLTNEVSRDKAHTGEAQIILQNKFSPTGICLAYHSHYSNSLDQFCLFASRYSRSDCSSKIANAGS